jgi:ribonuclease E
VERRERRDAADRFGGREDRGYADFADRRDERDRLGSRDSREGQDGRGGRDSRGGRETRSGREVRDPRDGRQTRDNWDLSERPEPRPAASLREDAERDERDRRGATRPNARPDARKNGSKPDRDALPAVKPRQGRNKRDNEGDWPTTEWDELSDVDYWAELASDKPLTTTVPAADTARSQRRAPRQDARQGQDARVGHGGRAGERQDVGERAEPPVKPINRQERQPERAVANAVSRTPPLTGSDRMANNPVATTGRSSRPIAADDDPLTSPSFPRITTEDSRSYRRTRAAAGETRHSASHSGPMPAIGADYTAPVGYPKPVTDHAVPGYTNSLPATHQMPAPASAAFTQANAGFSDLHGPGVSHSLPAGSARTYAATADPLNATYSEPGAGAGGYSLPGGMSAAGYLPSASLARDSYGGDTGVRSAYPGREPGGFLPEALQAGQLGQLGQHGQASYQNSPPQPSGYQATGSYPFPAEPVGYGVPHTDQPRGYQDPGAAFGSHQGPEAGYRAEGYNPGGSGPSAPESAPGSPSGHGGPGYPPAYPGPVPGGHTAPHQSPATQLPGYPEYDPGSYNQASVGSEAPQSPGYAGGDPYAADPYGFPGYGGTRY